MAGDRRPAGAPRQGAKLEAERNAARGRAPPQPSGPGAAGRGPLLPLGRLGVPSNVEGLVVAVSL